MFPDRNWSFGFLTGFPTELYTFGGLKDIAFR